jgi:ABC-2 type transport system permease protein
MYVVAVMGGMAQAVVDDRERFRTLKSMYVAPLAFPMYLIGRGAARFITTTLSVLITVVFGVMFLHLQISIGEIHWTLLLAAALLGLAMLSMMGLVLASIVLTIAHGSWLVGEAVAAALFLFCGAVFPIHVLPVYLQPVGYLMPVTYWPSWCGGLSWSTSPTGFRAHQRHQRQLLIVGRACRLGAVAAATSAAATTRARADRLRPMLIARPAARNREHGWRSAIVRR